MAEPASPTSLRGTFRIDIKRCGGVRVGKTGPFWSIGIQQQKTVPFLTSWAAATITSGVMKLAVPFSSSSPQTSHFFIVNPLSGQSVARFFSTHPPLEERIARLRAMAR